MATAYDIHQSLELRDLFSAMPIPNQGQDPTAASVIFVGLDANYAPELFDTGDFRMDCPGFSRLLRAIIRAQEEVHMSGQRYTPEFKDEAVRQVVERGYSVGEVAQRIGVSKHSLYKWVNAVKPNGDEEQAEELAQAKREILTLRADMRRLEEERDILKKAARYFAREPE